MANRDESIDFDPSLIDALDHRIQPLKRLLSPVSIGTEHVPREGPVLLAGNHTIYGLVDIPMLGLEIYEKTGRTVRGLGDHNHFAVPIWRDLLSRIGAVRGTREICVPPIARGRGLGPCRAWSVNTSSSASRSPPRATPAATRTVTPASPCASR
jgi:hypothetical protein